jgi:cellulose biosynthesis protein BcsQ
MPRWIAVVGRKGGSGKTALALGLAAHYARTGARVLLVDLDPQGSASLAMGADADGEHLAAILTGTADPKKVTYVTVSETLTLVPGGPALENVGGARPLRDVLAGVPVDVVLMDCPPGHVDLDRLALDAADVVLACTEAHRLGIAGAARVLGEARARKPAPSCALVLGRVDERRGLDRAAPDLLAGAFALPVLTIHQDSLLAGALNAGGLPPASGRAADDLAAVAKWVEGTKRKGARQ